MQSDIVQVLLSSCVKKVEMASSVDLLALKQTSEGPDRGVISDVLETPFLKTLH